MKMLRCPSCNLIHRLSSRFFALSIFCLALSASAQVESPVTWMTSPVSGATGYSIHTVSAGSDVVLSCSTHNNSIVTSVQYHIDGVPVGAAGSGLPYSVVWNTANATTGLHVATATVRTSQGNGSPQGAVKTSSGVYINVTRPAGSVPAPWLSASIGSVGVAGSASYATSGTVGNFTISGAGAGTGGSADAFHFVHQPIAGDSRIAAQVTSLSDTAGVERAGVMMRESLEANARFIAAYVTRANGIVVEYRTSTGGMAASTTYTGAGFAPPRALRIMRSGNSFTAAQSADGINWTALGAAVLIPMAPNGVPIHTGLAVTSTVTSAAATGVFNSVIAAPLVPAAAVLYANNFASSAAGWSPAWTVGSGIYSTTATSGTSVYGGQAFTTNHSFRFSMRPKSAGAGVKAGAVFNYIDANRYYKLLIAGDGSAQLLKKTSSGSPETVVASVGANSYWGYFSGTGTAPWIDVEIVRDGAFVTVRANGARLFYDVPLIDDALTGSGSIGLAFTGSSAGVEFDNVSVVPTPKVAYRENFDDGAFQQAQTVAGTWTVSGGSFNATSSHAQGIVILGDGVSTWVNNYTFSGSVLTPAGSAQSGLVYSYQNASNYYEVRLSAPGSDGNGTATLRTVVAGVTTTQTGTYPSAGTNQWNDITILRDPAGYTTVNVNGKRVFTNVLQDQLTATNLARVGVSAVNNAAAKFDDLQVQTGLDPYKRTFPKISTCAIGTPDWNTTTRQQQFAKYDLVELMAWKDWGGGGSAQHDAASQIKYNPTWGNPNIILAPYSAVTVHENHPDLTTKIDAHNWWARNSAGSVVPAVKEYPNEQWYVNSIFGAPDSNGWRYAQWFAWWRDTWFVQPTPEYDANYCDLFSMTYPYNGGLQPDWNRDGTDDPHISVAAMLTVRRGGAAYMQRSMALKPGYLGFGNVGNTIEMGGHPLETPEYKQLLHAALYEGAMGSHYSEETWQTWDTMMDGYRNLVDHTRWPNLVQFMAKGLQSGVAANPTVAAGFPNGYAFFRCAFASCLMEDGYFTANPEDSYTTALWFDEYYVRLGHPIDPPQRAPTQNGIYMRRFQNGVVLVNPRKEPAFNGGDPIPRTAQLINLPAGYRRIGPNSPGMPAGSSMQDSGTNSGAVVPAGNFQLQAGDGIILLKQ